MTNEQQFLDAIAVPLIGVDAELKVCAANAAACKVFSDVKIGKALSNALGIKSKTLKPLSEVLRVPGTTTLTIKTKAALSHEYLVTAKTVQPTENGIDIALVLTFEDRSPLRDASTMRSDFVANVSHEIRSPLTAITGFIETLQGAASDDAEARNVFLGLMAKEATRMTNLVTDLLSLSQVEAKERRAPKKVVELSDVLGQAEGTVRRLAQKRGKMIDMQLDGPFPPVAGKQDDLVRLFINLLENAINYSGDASQITLTAAPVSKDNPLRRKAVRVTITDQGEGIAAAEIPRLTERFYRIDKSRSRDVGGTGLGLAIVKHILVRHRGHMTIESTLGKGSTFSVYLPAQKT